MILIVATLSKKCLVKLNVLISKWVTQMDVTKVKAEWNPLIKSLLRTD